MPGHCFPDTKWTSIKPGLIEDKVFTTHQPNSYAIKVVPKPVPLSFWTIWSTLNLWLENYDTAATNIKMCVKMKLVVSMNKYSYVY